MADQTSTERLRALLDERGVEWERGLPTETIIREPIDALYVERPDGRMHVYLRIYFTPEQAIAATLGTGTCHDTGESRIFHCSECGYGVIDVYPDNGDEDEFPRFCPNCGRRVVEVDGWRKE